LNSSKNFINLTIDNISGMNPLSSCHQLFISFSFLLLLIVVKDKMFAQKTKRGAGKNSIQNFWAREVSNSELIVSVDYYYDENLDTNNLAILATASDINGGDGIDIMDDEVPLRSGNNAAILRLRMRPEKTSPV
jgi:chloramphenicol 3-O-phosphotransferase